MTNEPRTSCIRWHLRAPHSGSGSGGTLYTYDEALRQCFRLNLATDEAAWLFRVTHRPEYAPWWANQPRKDKG